MPLMAPRNVGFLAALAVSVPEDPGEEGGGGSHVGIDDSCGRVCTGEVGVATVEAVPAEPHDAAPYGYQGQAVRQGLLPVSLDARTDHGGGDKTADAGGQVDYVASREVGGTLLGPITAAPEEHAVDGVDDTRSTAVRKRSIP